MRLLTAFMLCMLVVLLAGCQESTPVCPTPAASPVFLSLAPDQLPTPTPVSAPSTVLIGRKEVQVDKIVSGALCNGTWSGTVYVGCDVQVYPWQDEPIFLKDCQLEIDPLTVVYVAYHNNTAYYNGCSCHTGETPQP